MSAGKQRCLLCDHGATAHDAMGCGFHIPVLDAGRAIVGSNRCSCGMSRSEIATGWDYRAVELAVNN